MLQEIVVVLIVLVCAAWLAVQGYRFFKPRPGGKACGGGCCDGGAPKPAASTGGEHVVMISSDDLRARVKARQG